MKATRSIVAAGLAQALATMLWWVFSIVMPEIDVPTGVIAASVAILGFGVSYFVPDTDTEVREMKREVDAKPPDPPV